METNDYETAQCLTKAGLKLRNPLNIAIVSDTTNESMHVGMCMITHTSCWYEEESSMSYSLSPKLTVQVFLHKLP